MPQAGEGTGAMELATINVGVVVACAVSIFGLALWISREKEGKAVTRHATWQ